MNPTGGSETLDRRLKQGLTALVWLAALALAAILLIYSREVIKTALTVLSPFIVALILAYIFNPVVRLFQYHLRVSRVLGVVVAYSLIVLLAVGFVGFLVPLLYTQLRDGIQNLIDYAPRVFERANEWLKLKVSPEDIEKVRQALRGQLTGENAAQAGAVAGAVGNVVAFLSKKVVAGVTLTLGFFAFLAFVVLISFYFLLDYSKIGKSVRVLLPEDKADRAFEIWERVDKALGGYLRGQLTICCILTVLYFIGLNLLGLGAYAAIIAFAAGFGNLIPYMGPLIGAIPTALWILFSDAYGDGQSKAMALVAVGAFTAFVQALDGLFLQPRIVGKSADLHPLMVILALLVGAQFGLGGLIIAVPLAVVAKVLLLELWWNPLVEKRKAEQAAPTPTA